MHTKNISLRSYGDKVHATLELHLQESVSVYLHIHAIAYSRWSSWLC